MAVEPQIKVRDSESQFPVGIVGAGVMGEGIAQVAALAGHPVRLYDVRPAAANAAVQRITAALDGLARKDKLTSGEARDAAQRLSPADSLRELGNCGLVVEAIVEDLSAKRALFRELEQIANRDALLATNTSSLSVTAIAAVLQNPQRLAGMHFFNPAPLMPLVEIVQAAATNPVVIDRLVSLAQRWGKTPVIARSTPGFIVNRVARPFYAEALRVLEERAADCATIDAVLREAGGFRMGPFELMDLIGNDVNYAVTRSVYDAFYGDARFTPSPLQFELVQAGYLGRKSGRGFYYYQDGKPLAVTNTVAACDPPRHIRIYGNTPLAQALADRLAAAGVRFEHACEHNDGRVCGWEDGVLYCTDGRTATARAAAGNIRNTVVMDIAFDDRKARRAAIAIADQASTSARDSASGLLQAAGYAVSVLDDVPGMVVLRTVAMLANVAAEAIQQAVCSVADLDRAMRLGVQYPRGPLEWADALGAHTVVEALEQLAASYGEARYRAAPLLRRKAITHSTFRATRAREPEQESSTRQPLREFAETASTSARESTQE